MAKATLLEKIVVNVFTPADYILSAFNDKVMPDGRDAVEINMFKDKVISYERLITRIERRYASGKGYTPNLIKKYDGSICGKIDIMLAKRRGLIPV
ncbi:hypothetical protein JXB11_02175 [Candidatus Woesearchaeota archaeon]|nr:hypothetical protein [Candidatus Woesearchaeota archaeon]